VNFARVALLAGAVALAGCAATGMETPSAPPAPLLGCPESVHVPAAEVEPAEYYPVDPRPTHSVPPVLPDIAREAGVSGTVELEVLVCEHGRILDARVVRSIPMLNDAAVAAIRQWTFEPARDATNHPVPCWKRIPMVFSLNP